jgi:hypothetical protein
VDAGVAERDETERPAMASDAVPAGVPPKRSDGEGQREKAERPESGLDLELFDGIRAQIIRQRATRDPGERQKADEDERNRLQTAAMRSWSLPRDRGRRQ